MCTAPSKDGGRFGADVQLSRGRSPPRPRPGQGWLGAAEPPRQAGLRRGPVSDPAAPRRLLRGPSEAVFPNCLLHVEAFLIPKRRPNLSAEGRLWIALGSCRGGLGCRPGGGTRDRPTQPPGTLGVCCDGRFLRRGRVRHHRAFSTAHLATATNRGCYPQDTVRPSFRGPPAMTFGTTRRWVSRSAPTPTLRPQLEAPLPLPDGGPSQSGGAEWGCRLCPGGHAARHGLFEKLGL